MDLNIRSIVQNNIPLVSAVIFIVLFSFFNMTKPSFAYNKHGHIRLFGLSYKSNTIFPVWLVAIVLAIAVYFFVMYFLAYPRINFKSL